MFMEWTGLNELRESYLSFFESKGHLRLPSASLIPQGDKSLLLINAGMAPLKKYFTGEVTPPRGRCTSCQKCVRTPDIERVGKTARHGTYFEMLGNFSFGDYFKREAIMWAWEYFTAVLKIPADRLYPSVFNEDDEAYDIWTKEVGVDESHMARLGREDNFWEHGAGPCGPSSEIYFDRGEKYGCGSPDCKVGCDCDRYVEVWNLVFTQFENDGNNNYTRLKSPNIDTGMGLERLACVMQGADNLFEVDTMLVLMNKVSAIAGKAYHDDPKSDMSLRVITDHIRSTVFLIADGVLPSNVGRGYVLRRLLRRAARHGRLLGIEKPFLSEIVPTVIHENKTAYPELTEKESYLIKIIAMEEESFGKTIDSGLALLNDMIKVSDGKTLSGADAFKLQDTYGFPLDLTKEILAENSMTVDGESFARLAENARQTARAARKDAGAEAWKNESLSIGDTPPTVFTGYEETKTQSQIVMLLSDGEPVDELPSCGEGVVVTDKTPFYAESGGQIADNGVITAKDAVFTVSGVQKTASGVYLHHGTLTAGALRVGGSVTCTIDTDKRLATRRNHTAAHLLQAALKSVLGAHVAQAGQYVSPDVVRFDFSHFAALTKDELTAVENRVNEVILTASPVISEEMSAEQAKASGATALFSEKYGETVRVVRCGAYSAELCGGTHAENTGELGLFKITAESSVAAGVRRIEGVTGINALNFIRERENELLKIAAAFKTNNLSELPDKAQKLAADLKSADREIAALKGEIARSKTADILSTPIEIAGIKLFAADMGEAQADALRAVCDGAKDKGGDIVAVVGARQSEKGTLSFVCFCGEDAIKKGAHAGNLVREIAKIAGGSGGGKPDSAMAGGKDVTKLGDALAAAEGILKTMLGG